MYLGLQDLPFSTNDSEKQLIQQCQHAVRSLEALHWRCKKGEHIFRSHHKQKEHACQEGCEHPSRLAVAFSVEQAANHASRLVTAANSQTASSFPLAKPPHHRRGQIGENAFGLHDATLSCPKIKQNQPKTYCPHSWEN